jgi:integrase
VYTVPGNPAPGLLDNDKEIPLFRDLAEQWLETHIKPVKRATTHKRYGSLLRMYINPAIGNIPVNEFRRVQVLQALRTMLNKGLSRASVEQGKNVISGVLEYAIDHEYLETNPTHGAMKRLGLPRKTNQKEVTVFTREEIGAILDTCKSYRLAYYPLFLTAFRTGMRLGELLALRWESINWRQQFIVVDSSWRNGTLTGTKTRKSRRVDLSDQLVVELKRLHTQRKEEALRSGASQVVPIIFHTKGTYTSQNSVRNIWKRVLAKAELDYRKFHCTRHTFASLLIADNQPLNYVKEMLRHHSIQMTVDVYGHLLPDQNKSAVNSLDDATIRNLSATRQKERAATI